ncbi:acyltransferase family protein [Sandaracinobacter sp.]|uniref:acyltransferase family protein n=1 Tax=Sandaracinobacter sp. TaxID=2487581 RepID=UPI0035B3BF0A
MGGQQRIYHLDALRCFCMLFGLALHGATIGNGPFFIAIKDASDHFRMATFFLVSGFFSAMVLSRGGAGDFIRNRARLLLLPMLIGTLLLNPPTLWLIRLFHLGDPQATGYVNGVWRLPISPSDFWGLNLLHLWFLATLFVYALLSPMLLALAGARPGVALAGMLMRVPGWLRLVLMTGAVALCVTVMRAVSDQLLVPRLPEPMHFLVRATMTNFAFFAAGAIGFRHRDLFETMHRLFWPGLLLVGAAYVLHGQWAGALPHALERASYWLLRSGFIFLIVCGLMAVARRLVTKGSPWLSRLTELVYSFYMFHFLIIYIIANLMLNLTDNLYLIFAAILLAGFPILVAIHEKIIARSPLLMLLFNGKIVRRAVPA